MRLKMPAILGGGRCFDVKEKRLRPGALEQGASMRGWVVETAVDLVRGFAINCDDCVSRSTAAEDTVRWTRLALAVGFSSLVQSL